MFLYQGTLAEEHPGEGDNVRLVCVLCEIECAGVSPAAVASATRLLVQTPVGGQAVCQTLYFYLAWTGRPHRAAKGQLGMMPTPVTCLGLMWVSVGMTL